MEGRRTQLRGSSREAHATERTSASSQTPRRAATGRSGGKAGLITTIAVIGAILGAAGPAAADDLVVRHVTIFGRGHGLQRAIIDESQHRKPERLIMAQH